MDWVELDWIGLGWIGLDWIGLDWIGLDWVGTSQNPPRILPQSYQDPPSPTPSPTESLTPGQFDSIELDLIGLVWTGLDRIEFGWWTGLDRIGLDRTGLGWRRFG